MTHRIYSFFNGPDEISSFGDSLLTCDDNNNNIGTGFHTGAQASFQALGARVRASDRKPHMMVGAALPCTG